MKDEDKIQHLAIIMDGNRRWAAEKGLPKMIGHTEGAKNLKTIARAASDRGIRYLTLWALSTENLKNRSETELKHLFSLFEKIPEHLHEFTERNGRLKIIGNLSVLPESTRRAFESVVEKTTRHTGMTLVLGVNYGGRDELIRTMKKMITDSVAPNAIDEALVDSYLDTADIPDPDLIIRTGGHQRLSGYLPWQSVYSELYFTPTHWPAFDEQALDTAIQWFQEQVRNKGK